jgi:hypothetical protein
MADAVMADMGAAICGPGEFLRWNLLPASLPKSKLPLGNVICKILKLNNKNELHTI